MASKKIKCENCGFEEELTSAQFNERKAEPGVCEQCDAALKLEDGAKSNNNAKEPAPADETQEAATPGEGAAEAGGAEAVKRGAKQAAEAAKAKFRQAGKNPEFLAGAIGCCLKKLTSLASFECLDKQTPKIIGLGHLALLALALLALVMGAIMSVRFGAFQPLGYGLGLAVFLILAQYLAVKSFRLFDGLIAAHPSRLADPALPEIVAVLDLLCAVGGVALIVSGIVADFSFSLIGLGLLLTLFSFLTAALFMQAEKQLSTTFDRSTPLGEQLLGLLSMHVKAAVKLVPFAYGFGLAVMTVMILLPLLILLVRGLNAQMSLLELPVLVSGALIFALAPILVYVTAMLAYLAIDLLKGVLSLNKK